MEEHYIWKHVNLEQGWFDVQTDRFDSIYPSWEKRRDQLVRDSAEYERFMEQLKRRQAIDTGIIERMYDLNRGITETFVKEGFVEAYLQHGDTDIPQNELMEYLKDNFEAMDFVFDFVKKERPMSVSYIKELHHLVTRHQDSTEGIDSMGNRKRVKLLKGEYKRWPNNPTRDGVTYYYCPPEQVASEMDELMRIYHKKLVNAHVLIRAGFLHHAFVQIHPFQDANGRMARLLVSFVLIQEGLFPFTISRDQRPEYISALEAADDGRYQALIDVLARNQISNMEQALNLSVVDNDTKFVNMIQLLNNRISAYKRRFEKEHRALLRKQMEAAFSILGEEIGHYYQSILEELQNVTVDMDSCPPGGSKDYYYSYQIAEYAKANDYYVNLSLDRCWMRMRFRFGETSDYRMVMTLHHFGRDQETFVVGAFMIKKDTADSSSADDKYLAAENFTLLEIPPLIFSAGISEDDARKLFAQQIELIMMKTLAYLANEIPI